MANKDRNKRSVRQARQRERAEHEALVAQSTAGNKGKAAKSQAPKKSAPVKVSATKKPGFITNVRNYLGAVRAEMRRVTWPGRTELTNYSAAVVAMLIAFGVAVWLVDTGFVAGLVAFTSLGR